MGLETLFSLANELRTWLEHWYMTTKKQANDLLEVRLGFAQGNVDKLLSFMF
jgi:hypothetical protein